MTYKSLFASVSFFSVLACAVTASAYETTTFSVALNDSSKTGTISLGQSDLGEGTSSITVGGNVYDVAYQYFTPTSTGTYVFGQIQSPADTVILLYSPTFATASPNLNYIENSDDGETSGIADAGLKAYVDAAIAGRSCDGDPELCPLLVSSLTAGVDYYIVVSTYSPGDSLGLSTDILDFFVIGDDAVGVGGTPPTPSSGYADTVSTSPVSGMADYLDANDGSGDLATVASYLDTATEQEVVDALKVIFPVNTSLAPQVMSRSNGQTATVLIDKVGTVLGNITPPSAASFTDGSFSTSNWVLGTTGQRAVEITTAGFAQQAETGAHGTDDPVLALSSLSYQRHESGAQAIWVQGVGGMANGEAGSATLGYDATSYGLVSGYEYALSETSMIGALGSVFRTHVDLDTDAGETAATTYSFGVYGQHQMDSIKLTGVFLASYGKYDSERFVNVGGITGSPQADYNGWGTSTSLQISKLYAQGDFKIEPFASANFSTATSEGYSEADGGVYNMVVAADATSSAAARTGVTVQYDDALESQALTLKARPYVGYRWELNGANTAVRLAGAGSSTVLNGRDISSLEVGLALEASYDVSSTSSVKLGLDVSHSKDEDSGLVYAGYGLKF